MPWTIDELPEERFLAGWRSVAGEAPAAMLDDRRTMIALLVESSPVLGLADPPSGLPSNLPADPVVELARRDRS